MVSRLRLDSAGIAETATKANWARATRQADSLRACILLGVGTLGSFWYSLVKTVLVVGDEADWKVGSRLESEEEAPALPR